MATVDGADVVDLAASIGTLEAGRRADIAVFGRSGADAYECVLDSRAEDVRLVMIDGLVYYGDLALEPLAVNGSCDDLDACGTAKFLCLADTPGATGGTSGSGEHLDDVRAQLVSVLGARSSELLELVDCAAD
jgi:5-methylthioadenosine/S-adenosylhomocysteine deaminase